MHSGYISVGTMYTLNLVINRINATPVYGLSQFILLPITKFCTTDPGQSAGVFCFFQRRKICSIRIQYIVRAKTKNCIRNSVSFLLKCKMRGTLMGKTFFGTFFWSETWKKQAFWEIDKKSFNRVKGISICSQFFTKKIIF